MRIYIGNKEIAGYFMRLKDGFDQLGIESDLWFLVDNKFYDVKVNPLVRTNQILFNFFKRNKRLYFLPILLPAILGMVFIHTVVLIYSLFRYDVFILNSQPFFTFQELAILKLFGKKVIIVFLGTESRPVYLSGNVIFGRYITSKGYQLKRCFTDARSQAKRIALIEKYADYVINHPPTALFQKKPYIGWFHMGFPNDDPKSTDRISENTSRIVRVLHAPSNSVSKGSEKIERIVENLRNGGLPVEFVKLQNVPNEKVIQEIQKCDLVVDELYSDVPIGGLGTEAAFARKAVINCGYYSEQIKTDYPHAEIPPSCFCIPENLELELKTLILDKQKRDKMAEDLNGFVRNNWNSKTIASKYLQLIIDDVPPEWFCNPKKSDYFLGYGIEKGKLRSFLKLYVNRYGMKALFLNDKAQLKSKIEDFLFMPKE